MPVALPAVSFFGGFRTPAVGGRGLLGHGRHPKSFTLADQVRRTGCRPCDCQPGIKHGRPTPGRGGLQECFREDRISLHL